jgi:hypothetical protein
MLSVVMLSVVILSVIMLSVVMPSVIMLSVVMLSVVMLSVVKLCVFVPNQLTTRDELRIIETFSVGPHTNAFSLWSRADISKTLFCAVRTSFH